jgi:periplasmic protein TonB
VAAILDTFHARPAIVSSIAALVLHAALVIALPRARTARALDLLPRSVEVDVPEPPTDPPPPPPPPAPAVNPGAAGGGASAPVRAPAILARNERIESPTPEAPIVSGDGELPLPGHAGSGAGDAGTDGASGSDAGPPGPPATPLVLPPPPPPAIDRSRAPALARNGQWSCPWPPEADPIDDAVVVVAVVIDAAGHATRVDVLGDPGYGFGREARRCALRETYVPGLDREGRPAVSVTKPFRVRFTR